jgi:hypothetical protein
MNRKTKMESERAIETEKAQLPADPPEPLSSTLANESTPEVQSKSMSGLKQTVPIARWIIFFQAGLLGITATTFFVFGLMVGNFTASGSATTQSSANPSSTASYVNDCKISGQVTIQKRNKKEPDTGAVVILLPEDARPEEKQDPSLIMPERFVPLDNPAIEAIHESGGAVVRADRRGEFQVLVDQNRKYVLLVISKNKPNHPDRELTKKQIAMIGTFFSPVEKLVQGKEIFWDELVTDQERIDQPSIEF